MRCPVGAVKASALASAQSTGDVVVVLLAFFFCCLAKKNRSEIAMHGNLGCRSSDFPRACCDERLFCRETLKSPRRRRQIAALGKASKGEFARSLQGVVCALPSCFLQMYFPGDWRSEAASEGRKNFLFPVRRAALRCCSSGIVSPRLRGGNFGASVGFFCSWERQWDAPASQAVSVRLGMKEPGRILEGVEGKEI